MDMLKSFLTFMTIGCVAAIFIYIILRRRVPGKFWGALVIGFIGSFLGGVIYQSIPEFFDYLADFNSVNVFAAFFCSISLIWILSKLTSSK